MTVKTLFAPAERATPEQVEHDAQVLAQAGIVDHITHVIPSILMVLNKERQVVYSNQRLQEFLDVSPDHDVLGLRPGEILDCIHSTNGCGGCGTTEFCSQCGAVKAILKSQDEQVGVEAECRITTQSGKALEFNVWASPYHCGDSDFTIFTIIDIHNEKRRQALEQTFFHDMANVLMAITGHSKLLEMPHDEEEAVHSIEAIRMASKELTSEIWCHRKLLQAEHGELEVELKPGINSLVLVNELRTLCSERKLELDSNSEEFELTTDRTLLFRVLFNMVKNANEAAALDETVTISCRREDDTGIFSVHNPNYMPRPVQLQVFQRSFTTKGTGHGVGSYSMRLFGETFLKGKVGFSTSEQTGTTFYIAVPLEYPG
ncbi:hypothetical protein PDESU_05298 [Pontiella desulfatans]|uniref:Histidine kinase domain-containing protein n=1 Tax=Pontiella desulfatans TaxID=2750659 RepID=A0A6C2UAI1_PONDE|nr:HAMP domain-containing sensor histidine kinase [Pontiella desulfatans]VGO16707.1 hypothetical protein PDESU_05298 [Pontiella desulfatans]